MSGFVEAVKVRLVLAGIYAFSILMVVLASLLGWIIWRLAVHFWNWL